MNIQEIGYFLFMEEQEKKKREEEQMQREEVNAELKTLLVGEVPTQYKNKP